MAKDNPVVKETEESTHEVYEMKALLVNETKGGNVKPILS